MQAITRWLNLSETTFLVRPTTAEADYRVRIFTLDREMPFAGHPTLGTCHAWLSRSGQPRRDDVIVQECGAGLIEVRRGPGPLSFAAPALMRDGPIEESRIVEIAEVLRIDRSDILSAEWADNGPGWILVTLASADAVLALEPRRDLSSHLDLGVVGLRAPDQETAYEVRAFFTADAGALREDPVTGSLNAAIAQTLLAQGKVSAPYIAAQGTRLGRQGRIYIEQDAGGQVWVGGRTTTLFSGTTPL